VTDARLREARRVAADGDDAARARELVELVRAGRLGRDRLELAAYAGDAAARLATGEECSCGLVGDRVTAGELLRRAAPDAPTARANPEPYSCLDLNLDAWLHGLSRWGPRACTAALVGACRAALATWSGWDPTVAGGWQDETVRAYEAWVDGGGDPPVGIELAGGGPVQQIPGGPWWGLTVVARGRGDLAACVRSASGWVLAPALELAVKRRVRRWALALPPGPVA
jgi:hypothetical protein